jgi:hypothetical protein
MHRPSLSLAVAIAAAALFTPALAHAQVLTPGVDQPYNGGLSSNSREAPRVLQTFFDNSFLTDVTTPTTLTGLSFRLPAIASSVPANVPYPKVDLTFARYDITLAKPSQAAIDANALVSDTFADNMQNPVAVRTGQLTIPAGSLTDNDTGPGPEGSAEFSFFIPFSTPYTLQPGDDLVVLVRQSGHGNNDEIKWNFDSFGYTSGGRVATGNTDAASGALVPDTVMKYAFQVQSTPAVPGDADGDGDADLDDIGIWATNFTGSLAPGAGTGTLSQGDFDADKDIDLDDQGIWAANFTGSLAPAGFVAAVPEPASLAACGLASLSLFARRRTRRA